MSNKDKQIDQSRSMALFAEYNPAPVFRFNNKGTVLQANPAANNIFCSKKNIEGLNIKELTKGFADFDLPKLISQGSIGHIMEKVGKKCYRLEFRGIPEYGICQVYGADITEIQQNKKEIQQLSIAIEQSSSLIQITDTKGKIEFVNNAFERITGFKREDIIGKNPKVLKTNHLPKEVYEELWKTISAGDVWKGEFHNRKKDGSTYWEEATISPVKNDSGEIISYIAVKEDITLKKKAEKEIRSMALFAKLNPEPVFRFNKEKIILQSNPAADDIFKKGNIVGLNIIDLLPDIEKYDIELLISNNDIIILTHHINESIFRFIIRGISELGVCQIYGSDITERVMAAERIKQQKEEIEEQHDEIKAQRDYIAEQSKRTTDSIQYASRIQDAILPSKPTIIEYLPEHFVFFRPRDIVSGDFYWTTLKDNKVVIVAADCTGHGVPGAFMSMLGVSFLNEIVNKNPITTADIILNKLRDYVKSTLSQSSDGSETKDGMDLALAIVDFNTMQLQFSGAYNPLLYFRNNELIEIKADKMPIGLHIIEEQSFTNHIIQIQKGDMFYMYSDGFPDQIGGKKRRKYMRKPFKKLLYDIHKKPMLEQKNLLGKELHDWQGDYEQIDDILVVGFRV